MRRGENGRLAACRGASSTSRKVPARSLPAGRAAGEMRVRPDTLAPAAL